jgi:carbon-monoxide dehydrogenase medium subunit
LKFVPAAGFVPTSFRTLPGFRLARAATIAEAIDALGNADRAAVLAGGTDLPARFNEGFAPTDVVDISRLQDLRTVAVVGDALEIGATVTHAVGSAHTLIRQHLPSLSKAWSRIANVRIRFSATIGGNLMARRTRYEGAILLSALQARLRLRSASGNFEIPVEEIWSAELPAAALLTHIVIPLRKGIRFDYARDLRPIMTQAVAFDDSGAGRVVTATEYAVPCIRALAPNDPQLTHGELDLVDPVTSLAYLRRASAALLARQLERMRTS